MNLSSSNFFWFSQSGLSVRAQVKNLGGDNHSTTLRTIDVLYFLLVVEGQGAQPRASGIRKQSADAGSATPGRPQGEFEVQQVEGKTPRNDVQNEMCIV